MYQPTDTLHAADTVCPLCPVEIDLRATDSWANVTSIGRQSLLKFSELRNDLGVRDYVLGKTEGLRVHIKCRRDYTSQRKYEQEQRAQSYEKVIPAKRLRSSFDISFDWKNHCWLCGKTAKVDTKHPDRNNVSVVATLEIRDTVLDYCFQRNDAWALEVQGRLNSCCDLVAEEAIYHRPCYVAFTLLRPCPFSDGEPNNLSKIGRPVCDKKSQTFDLLCAWIELHDDELYTLDDLQAKSLEIAVGDENCVYSKVQLKTKLLDKYQDHIFFAEVAGKRNVICFKNMAACVLTEKWYAERNAELIDESLRVVIAAAKLVKAQIRETEYDNDTYPLCSEFENEQLARRWVPTLLDAFMTHLVCDGRKQVALSHCIVQASRPRSVISPILYGLGVSVDHKIGSEWLLNNLSRLGLSISYDEVYRCKQSVVQSEHKDLPAEFPMAFSQFSADNVDHNICTLDGVGSFHGMGIISMSTPCSSEGSGRFSQISVPRLKRVNVDSLTVNQGIPILSYQTPDRAALSDLQLKPMHLLRQHFLSYDLPSVLKLDLLWHAGYFFQDDLRRRPNWAGFMQDVSVPADDFHPAADIRMLPIIDLNPNDMSCIYSTLSFVEKQAKRLNMEVACITFDQPLFIKAVEIVRSCSMNVVCRLGGFHVLMNFLGAIGTIMAGSGLCEALETCYGPVTLSHMMTGKAYAKAIRGHFLAESALMVLLMNSMFKSCVAEDVPSDVISVTQLDSSDINTLQAQYNELVTHSYNFASSGDVRYQSSLQSLDDQIAALKSDITKDDRTARLWMQYLFYISIVKQFLRAERTADWQLHLYTLSLMLNLFAASGHRNYTKSARLYLQLMLELPESNPWLHRQLSSGRHAVRRSSRHWAGLSTDLAIEQVMMRAVKSNGGLTRGRGMTESVRLNWVQSMHFRATAFSALTSLTNVDRAPIERQHVDLGPARIARDCKDLTKVIQWFRSNNPFDGTDKRLHSLASGLVACANIEVNCDAAESVGERIMLQIDNLCYSDIVLRKVDRAKTLAEGCSRKVVSGDKRLPVDSSVLFSRLLVVVQREKDVSSMFKYELTSVPTAFFSGDKMRKTVKSQLAKELSSLTVSSSAKLPPATYVVDGGWLLHKVKWSPGGSYDDIAAQYVNYVGRHFGMQTLVVFDGYGDGPSVKDHEHERRATKASPDLVFDAHRSVYGNQGAFLANSRNKEKFVSFLTGRFREAGFTTHQAKDDADTLIVLHAIELAKTTNVVVVANDTDIMVLLVYHFKFSFSDIFLHSEMSTKSAGRTSVISIRDIRTAIGDDVARQLLVIHAISGCDSTSSLYGHGKASVWRKISGNSNTLSLTDVIDSCNGSHESVAAAGLKLLVLLYGGKLNDSLNSMRFTRYMDITATSTMPLRPERLPPTENAATFHVYRTHLQVVQWKTLMNTDINPEEWGWKVIDNHFVPVATDLAAAPETMLTIIRCKCHTDTRHPCSAQKCTCVKYGLPCVASCKHCKGCDCENASMTDSLSDDVDDGKMGQLAALDDITDIMSEDGMEFALPWHDEEVV